METNATQDTIDLIAQHWGLEHISLYYAFQQRRVFTAIMTETNAPVMVKLSTDESTLHHEIIALKTFQGHGCVNLLDTAPALGAILLERLLPGQSLETLFPAHDAQTIAHAAKVMHLLHGAPVPTDQSLPTLAEWFDRLLHAPSPLLPPTLVATAQRITKELFATMAPVVLLHGDLHHNNILASGDNWVAIDPHGVLGEPLYEVGAFIRNPITPLLQQDNPADIIAQRLDAFAQLMHAPRQRVAAWSFVQAVLAAQWATEDNGDHLPWLTVATILERETTGETVS